MGYEPILDEPDDEFCEECGWEHEVDSECLDPDSYYDTLEEANGEE